MRHKNHTRRASGFTAVARALTCSTVIGLALPAVLAHAEETPESLINQGVVLRRQGKDIAAQGYFRRAYELAHTPRSAAQLALVELAISDFWHAEKHFSEALSNPDAWVVSQKAALESAEEKTRKHLASLSVKGLPSGAAVDVLAPGWKIPETVSPDAEGLVWLPEGTIQIVASAPRFKSASTTVSAVAKQTSTWRVTLEPVEPTAPAPLARPVAPPPSPAPATEGGSQATTDAPPKPERDSSAEPDGGRIWRRVGVGLAIAGTGATIAGFVFRSTATTKLDHINNAGTVGGTYDPSDGNWKTYDRLGVGLIAGGLVSIAGGAALYFFNRSSSPPAAQASAGGTSALNVALGLNPREAVVIWGRF